MNLALTCCHFNPQSYARPVANYYRFLHDLGDYADLLTTIELVLDDDEPDIPDATIHIRGTREKHVLWQKERLLNIVIQSLPTDVDAVAWLDADITFLSPSWFEDTVTALEKSALVQMLDRIVAIDEKYSIASVNAGAAFAALTGKKSPLTGYAWACRRELLDGIGLPDRCIAGAGDTLIWRGAIGGKRCDCLKCMQISRAQVLYEDRWGAEMLRRTKRKVGYTPGAVLHHFHGTVANRQYKPRQSILNDAEYDPLLDVVVEPNGLLAFSGNKPELEAALATYFADRKEDGEADACTLSAAC